MTEREEIDMLRRLVADLTERVRALEERKSTHVVHDATMHIHVHRMTPMLAPMFGVQPERRDPLRREYVPSRAIGSEV